MIAGAKKECPKDFKDLNTTLIRNLKKKIKELKESEEKYRTVINNTKDLICVLDREGRLTFCSDNCSKYGYTVDEVVGKKMDSFIHPDDLESAREDLARTMETGREEPTLFRLRMKDGRYSHVEEVGKLIEGKDGSKKIISVIRDVSDRKRAEQKMKESEDMLKAVFEGANDGILLVNLKTGKFESGNRSIQELTGYSIKELRGMGIPDLHPKEDLPRVMEKFRMQEKGKIRVAEDVPVLRKDGEVIFCDVSSSKIKVGDAEYVVGFFRDITKSKEAEDELRAEKERAEKYLEIAGTIIVVIDADGRILMINRKGCDILGYEKRELLGKNWFTTCIPRELRKKVKEVHKKNMEGKTREVEHFENQVVKKDGSRRLISWHNTTIRDKEGKVLGSLSSGEDITEKRKQEQDIKKANESLKDSNLALVRDMKRMKEYKKKVREATQLNKEIIKRLPVGVYILNREGDIEYANRAMARISGVDKKKFMEVKPFELPTYRKMGLSDRIKDVFRGKTFSVGPVEYTSHLGRKKTLREFVGIPIRKDGNIEKALIVVQDITGISDKVKMLKRKYKEKG